MVQAVSGCQATVLTDMSIAPSAKDVALGGLGPDILAVAIDLGDGGVAAAGAEHVAVGQARGVSRVGRVGFPDDLAGPVDLDDLVLVVLGDQHVAVGQELGVAPPFPPGYFPGTA